MLSQKGKEARFSSVAESTSTSLTRTRISFRVTELVIIIVTIIMAHASWMGKRSDIKRFSSQRVSAQSQFLGSTFVARMFGYSAFAASVHPIGASRFSNAGPSPILPEEIQGLFHATFSLDELVLFDQDKRLIQRFRRETGLNEKIVQLKTYPPWFDSSVRDTLDALQQRKLSILTFRIGDSQEDTYSFLLVSPLFNNDNALLGYLVAQYNFGMMASWLFSMNRGDSGTEYLLDQQGQCLITPIRENGPPSPTPEINDEHFARQFPDEWAQLKSKKPVQIITANGLFTARPLGLDHDDRVIMTDGDIGHLLMNWITIEHISSAELRASMWRVVYLPLGIGLLLLIATRTIFIIQRAQIAKRQKIEQRVQDLNEIFTSVIEGSPLAITVMDPRGKVIHWNQAATKMFGWSQDEVIGAFNPMVHENDVNQFKANFQRVLNADKPVEYDVHPHHRDGRRLDLHIWTTTIGHINGRPSAVLGMFADVSEQRRTQEAEDRASKMETVHMMARTVAHEFRQPLAALSIVAELAALNKNKPDELERSINKIPELVNRMENLVLRMLNLTEVKDKTYWRDISILDLGNQPDNNEDIQDYSPLKNKPLASSH